MYSDTPRTYNVTMCGMFPIATVFLGYTLLDRAMSTTQDQTNMQQGVPKMDGNSMAWLQFILGPRVRRFWSSLLLPICGPQIRPNIASSPFMGSAESITPQQQKNLGSNVTSPRSRKSLDQFQPSRLG